MKKIVEAQKFFSEDPLGKKVVQIFKELGEVVQSLRMKVREALKIYLQRLLKED